MPLSDFVVVVVTKEGGAVTRAGQSTPIFINSNAKQSARVNYYSDMDAVAVDFADTDEFYKWAGIVFQQNPAPTRVASGRIDAGDANITASMDAIAAFDNTGWYGINIEARTDSEITDVAAWIASRDKVGGFQTSDGDILTATAPNIATVLTATNNKKVHLFYHDDDTEYVDAAMIGLGMAADLDAPGGQITWALKQLTGVPVDSLNDTEQANCKAQNCNIYIEIAGRGVTTDGVSVEGEFIDVQTTLDWLKFRTQENVFRALATTSTKVPFTNAGIAIVEAELRGVVELGKTNGHLSTDTEPVYRIPDITDVQQADKEVRWLRTLEADDTLAGAIHKTSVRIRVQA